MKIIHTEASLGWGGQEIRILSEASGIEKMGHEIEIWASPNSNIIREATAMGLKIKPLPISEKRISNIFKIRSEIKKSAPDIINTHSSTDTWLVALANTTIRNSPPLIRTRHISAPVPKNFASRWLYTHATTHIVTTGNALKKQLVEENGFPASNITSIPTGIDIKRFYPGDRFEARKNLGISEDNKYIGILATLRSWKGHLYLLDAFSKLDIPEWRLLIIGDGPMRKPIEEKIKQLNINDRVLMVGQQKNPEEWLRALDIFCLPSYANEGVPQAIIQAMLSEIAIISTPIGAINEIITDGHSGLLVTPRNSKQLAYAIKKLSQDIALMTKLSATARTYAFDRLQLERMINKMEALFYQSAGIRKIQK